MQELFANMVAPSQDARNGPMADPVGWSDVLRQRDARLTQMADIRPPYDQGEVRIYLFLFYRFYCKYKIIFTRIHKEENEKCRCRFCR